MRPDELERPWERLDAVGPAPRAELLHVLMLPDFERADRIGEFWSYPQAVPPSTDSSSYRDRKHPRLASARRAGYGGRPRGVVLAGDRHTDWENI